MNTSARQTVTRNKLDQIESAIVGSPTHSSRFLNDMGRLPVIVDEISINQTKITNGIVLSELWYSERFDTVTNNPSIDYKGYDDEITKNFTNNAPIRVTINGGWKGPYLNVTNQKLYDGFGNDFHVANPSANNKITEWDHFDEIKNEFMVELPNNTTDLNLPKKTILKFGSFGEDDKFNDSKSNWQNTDDIKMFHYSQVFSTLHVNFLLRDSSVSPATWLPAKFIEKEIKAYDKNTSTYTTGSIVEVEKNEKKYLFICTYSSSTSACTEDPNWSFTGVTTDGQDREWIWLSRTTCLNRFRVTVFSPYVETKLDETKQYKNTLVRAATAFYPYSDSQNNGLTLWGQDLKIFHPSNDYSTWDTDDLLPIVKIQGNGMGTKVNNQNGDTINEVTFHNLTPGIRKIFAYGYAEYEIKTEESSTPKYSNARHSNVQTIELKPGENFITIYLHESFFD
jgi:hypothetical protein